MNRSYFKWLIILAALSILLVAFFMKNENDLSQLAPPIQQTIRPISPFKSYIAAVGIVEPCGGNVFIGSPVNRLVDKVEVSVGQKVKVGDILFRLEARDLSADLAARLIAYENAVANLQKTESLPRIEDVSSAEASLKSAQVELDQAKSQYVRVEGLQNSGAMSREEVSRRKYVFDEAQAKYNMAESNYKKTKAGAWKPDLEIAKLQVDQAKADVQRVEADIERTIIRAPLNASVLQIKIHEGEFPPGDSSRNPPMIIGDTDKMCLRVSINQFDASFYSKNSLAVAFLQGNAKLNFPLTFLHVEPFFVTKQNLTNDISEKVDTRVLQSVYGFKEGEEKVFVGQQMDVFIETNYDINP